VATVTSASVGAPSASTSALVDGNDLTLDIFPAYFTDVFGVPVEAPSTTASVG
jgi:hypothetical protein